MNIQTQKARKSLLMGTAFSLLLGMPLLAQAGSGNYEEGYSRGDGDRFHSRGSDSRDSRNGDSFATKEFDWADNMGPEDGYGSQNPREFYRGRSDRDFRSDRFDRNNYRQGNEDIDGIIAIYGYETDRRSTRRDNSGRENDPYARDYAPYGEDWDTGEARDTEERYYTDQYGDVDTMWEEYDYGGDFDFRSADDRRFSDRRGDRRFSDYPSSERYRSRGHYRDPEAFWDAQPYVSPDTYRYDDNR